MTSSSALTAIIGGGIAGLTAAWTLQQAGHACVVLEASDRCGGSIRSEQANGFLFEGGPDSFLASKPAAFELCRELGIEEELIGTEPQPGGPRLLYRGQMQPLPAGWRMLAPTRLGPVLRSPLFSPAVKAALAWRWWRSATPPRAEETVAAYLDRRFGCRVGRAFTRIVVQPLLAGVYGGAAGQLSAALAQPPPKPPSSGLDRNSMFLTLRTGMGALVEHLTERLAPHIHLQCGVRTIAATPTGYRMALDGGQTLDAARVILAVPAWYAATLLQPLDASLAALLAPIAFSSSVNVNLAYRQSPSLPAGHGFLAVDAPGLLACTFAHQKFSGRAPAGGALLRLFYGPAAADQSDNLLEARARADLVSTLRITAPPDMVRIQCCHRAIPQYGVDHSERLRQLNTVLVSHPRLALAGNAYGGVGVPDCIASGRAAAARLLAL